MTDQSPTLEKNPESSPESSNEKAVSALMDAALITAGCLTAFLGNLLAKGMPREMAFRLTEEANRLLWAGLLGLPEQTVRMVDGLDPIE